MRVCRSCGNEMAAANRFCSVCGSPGPLAVSAVETVAIPQHRAPSSSSIDEGRFPAGTLLAGRYRILGLLGSGGMGEVYRANDTKLGQPVALKFLPEKMLGNERLLARFHGEVRIARQVSHPNVCRVYDIGEYQGVPFLTMEYVDGEDLGSLLRRIGRLPGDKAVEIARRLCAGLAAAHDKGVLHRDLKPSNIMIDGRGQVLITDFGLAGLLGQVEGVELRNGTPAYMAPEQLAGKEVSIRSDIYSLGLVLYEMFTGKRLFDGTSNRTTPTSLSTVVKDIDPAAERVILRSLAEDPKDRPSSALALAAALPGGDPLLAALAAGETPSPEMVAAAGETATISVRTIVSCLAATIVGIALAISLGQSLVLIRKIPFENSAQVLAQKAQDLVRSFGYTARPRDSAFGFSFSETYLRYLERHEKPELIRAQLAAGQPAAVYSWYRESPQYMEVQGRSPAVSMTNPPMTVSGMVQINLDTQGRLLRFIAVPPQFEKSGAAPAQEVEWNVLLRAAGIDLQRFTPVEPEWIPLSGFDARSAWTGSYAHAPALPIRIEAAAWRGRPVYFDVIGPWTVPVRMLPDQRTRQQIVVGWVNLSMAFAIFGLAAVLAWRNWRTGRADGRGSFRLASFTIVCIMLEWACMANHIPTAQEFTSFTSALGFALLNGAAYGVLYMALEPYVRRRWPQSLVSWAQLLQGGWRDPLVGGHVLVGTALGIGFALIFGIAEVLMAPQGRLMHQAILNVLVGTRETAAMYLAILVEAIGAALALLFTFFLLRAMLRREWLAAAVFGFLFAIPPLAGDYPLIQGSVSIAVVLLALWTLIRCGVLPMVLGIFVSGVLSSVPATWDFTVWYAGKMVLSVLFVLAIAVFAAHTALAGRPLLRGNLLES
jgi:Protein kinase domain